ncbi:MAG: dephospho-CoA kinase [Nitrospirae bacterium]|nr:dephospho-CoA kinase [Nitrospirota bacterium]
MLLVGLTGGIATGKSLVSEMFRSLGAHIIDADLLSRDLVKPGSPALTRIVGEFGPEVLSEDGRLNRHLLAEMIFHDPGKREALNAILHPRIFEEEERRRKEIAAKDPRAIIIFDAALLIETGAHELMDCVILIYVNEKNQVARLMERDHLTKEAALKRIRAQMPMKEKRKHADYILDTSHSFQEVEKQVERIYRDLREIEAGRKPEP